ncbi:hypothetical protein BDBG_17729 [Blastomyces gilchristii SLH14081]|uniref:Uncharacterized protein n=1 Tax=Blastomyces gilchristii (strain SLH14081) TaxID=559298 RepID=A0A179UYN9_BLAGS|nr:uncharacterized protein BDBG_17729 [Blastomyces gilchristii SLH14081]OAT12933.1 hypothetical protein BDBG_17729 [Blastomyces gilchristii SLH14081]
MARFVLPRLKINHQRVLADSLEIKLATFKVLDGANKLTRNEKEEPVFGKAVGGALKNDEVNPDDAVIVDTVKKQN